MTTPTGTFTIAEAAEKWIAMIEDSATKATAEQKATMISQIREAAPKVMASYDKNGFYAGKVPATTQTFSFVAATNEIKAVMRGQAK